MAGLMRPAPSSVCMSTLTLEATDVSPEMGGGVSTMMSGVGGGRLMEPNAAPSSSSANGSANGSSRNSEEDSEDFGSGAGGLEENGDHIGTIRQATTGKRVSA